MHSNLRIFRRLLAVLILIVYLAAGVLHGIVDLDMADVSGAKFATVIGKQSEQQGKGLVADYHCHGCFSVTMPAPAAAAFRFEPMHEPVVMQVVFRRGPFPGIDPRPPKYLT